MNPADYWKRNYKIPSNKRELYCHKCEKQEFECRCKDKYYRLHHFENKLLSARLQVGFGGGSQEERELFRKIGY